MSDRPVWMVDTPGVDHPASDARAQVFLATSGESGFVASTGGGLAITPGDSGSVRIYPCSVVAVSRYAGHVDQSYAFRVPSAVDVPIRAASSGGSRMDAIILRVRDRVIEGIPTSEDPNDDDYWEPVVLEGVPSSTGYTEDGIAAWKQIDYPFVLVGTALVSRSSSAVSATQFMGNIIHARSDEIDPIVYQPSRRFRVGQTGSYFEDFSDPLYFDVPWWANWATFKILISGFHLAGQNSYGNLSAVTMDRALKYTNWNVDLSDGGARSTWMVAGKARIQEEYRGQTQSLRLRVSNALRDSWVTLDEKSIVVVEIRFQQATEFVGE